MPASIATLACVSLRASRFCFNLVMVAKNKRIEANLSRKYFRNIILDSLTIVC